jgi:glutamate formiminotransferase/formiminotetrahydrofolate cyclodeaminase
MVANLSAHKRGWDDRWEEFSDWAEKGKAHHDALLRLIDEDTAAFKGVMSAFGLPQGTAAEKAARQATVQAATKNAIEVPLTVMETALSSMEVMRAMAEIGNPASVSDAGVGALCARSAVMGAFLNVRINLAGLDDKALAADFLKRGRKIETKAVALEKDILDIVNGKMQ